MTVRLVHLDHSGVREHYDLNICCRKTELYDSVTTSVYSRDVAYTRSLVYHDEPDVRGEKEMGIANGNALPDKYVKKPTWDNNAHRF